MNQTDYTYNDRDLRRIWSNGWHLDLEYMKPRIVFHKSAGSGNSTCYMYEPKDFDDHLKTCGLTNLEFIEGKLFYKEHQKEINKHA